VTWRRLLVPLWAAIPLAVLAIFFIYPVAGMLHRGLWPDGTFAPGDFLAGFAGPRVRRVVWFTVWSASAATAGAVILGLPVAYALHQLRFRGQGLLQALVFVPFVMPTIVVGIAFRRLLMEGGPLGALGLDGSPIAIIAAMIFFNIAVVVRTVGAFWAGLDPRRTQAAATLGATPRQIFLTITLPALLPGIISAIGVVFLFCATAFGVVLVMGGLRYANLETEIYLLTTTQLDLSGAAALSVLQFVFLLVLLTLTHFVRRDAATPRGVAQVHPRPGWRDVPVLVWTAVVMVFLMLPLASLVLSSLKRGDAWSLANYAALVTTGEGEVLLVTPVQALANSLLVAAFASLSALFLGLIVAVLVTRRNRTRWGRRLAAGFDAAFMLPLGVSAVTVGFGFLITVYGPPLSLGGSPLLVPIAQAMVALPLVVRSVAPALAMIDDRQRQAAAVLGASPGRVLLGIDLPTVWRPLVAAFGFAFAVSLGEFGATSFLARQDAPTLPVVIYQLLGRREPENFGIAMAAAVLLSVATIAVIMLVQRTRVRSVGVW
jgi:thiamine transport system permease protein